MATIVFSALGTLVGGPAGGAIGALLGREVDRAVIGGPRREGARLTELAVSTSSYGQPIARLFGATRAAGTIIWATDLAEASETAGGKGQPRTTQYSYSVSFAVALSSRPILGIGRIWADGNLLRGAAGDLKTGGILRFHTGHADQEPDPLLAASLGEQCPAFRGLAYAVFEDLQLADFGNRIPALSFEVFATGAGEALVPALAALPGMQIASEGVPQAADLAGFAHEGGSLGQVLDLLGQAVPLQADAGDAGLAIGPGNPLGSPLDLPPAVAWADGEFGTRTGMMRTRSDAQGPAILRYYDSGRDYQPGVQRAPGRARLAGDSTLELPATLSADGARALVGEVRARALARRERMQARIAALDPRIAPGAVMAIPGQGNWRVSAWEWRSGGIELELQRPDAEGQPAPQGDAGFPWRPADRLAATTLLDAFELPWDGSGSPEAVRVHAAPSAGPGRWAGAALYIERAGALVPFGTTGLVRAATGSLALPLGGSPGLMFEADAWLEVQCDDPEAEFMSADSVSFAAGANRLLVGEEIVQFMEASALGSGRWRLSGLLRGRGATELEALAGHAAGTPACLLDTRLQLLDGTGFDAASERLAALGIGDLAPVFAQVRAPGRSRRPLAPVHPVAIPEAGGGVRFEWTRRARGAWIWGDGVEVPLVEEFERYEVGAGPLEAPFAIWETAAPTLALSSADLEPLAPDTAIWVRQVGSHASPPLALCTLT